MKKRELALWIRNNGRLLGNYSWREPFCRDSRNTMLSDICSVTLQNKNRSARTYYAQMSNWRL